MGQVSYLTGQRKNLGRNCTQEDTSRTFREAGSHPGASRSPGRQVDRSIGIVGVVVRPEECCAAVSAVRLRLPGGRRGACGVQRKGGGGGSGLSRSAVSGERLGRGSRVHFPEQPLPSLQVRHRRRDNTGLPNPEKCSRPG